MQHKVKLRLKCACNQRGVIRHFHEAGSLPIELSIKLVVCLKSEMQHQMRSSNKVSADAIGQ